MTSQNSIFLIFAAILVYAALRVVTVRNPVHATLHLILAFFTAGALWALIGAEFLAIALILIYVGAVMVLFLFVVMMLDINIDKIRQGFWRYAPVGFFVGAVVLAEMLMVLGNSYFKNQTMLTQNGTSNVRQIGTLLFTEYAFAFEAASLILLVAMIAAIVLTLRGKKSSRYTDPAKQIGISAEGRIRIVKMPSEPVNNKPSVSGEIK